LVTFSKSYVGKQKCVFLSDHSPCSMFFLTAVIRYCMQVSLTCCQTLPFVCRLLTVFRCNLTLGHLVTMTRERGRESRFLTAHQHKNRPISAIRGKNRIKYDNQVNYGKYLTTFNVKSKGV